MVYYYHHSDKIPNKPIEEDRGGFANPFDLVVAGWAEREKTGRTPHPKELSDRLVRRWVDDLNHFGELIERGRPKDKPDANNEQPS